MQPKFRAGIAAMAIAVCATATLAAGPATATTLTAPDVATAPSPTAATSPSTGASPSASTSPTASASPTGSASPTAAPSPTSVANDDPSLAEMNATGNHTMGSTIPATVAAAGPKVRALATVNAAVPGTAGFDVSAWQTNNTIDWAGQYNAGARFVYMKATESTTYQSSQFGAQYNSATAAGYVRGAYHFAVPNKSSGATQANYFADHGGGWSPDGKTLPPLLDIEYNPYSGTDGTNSCYGLSQGAMVSWISDFSNTVRARTGTFPAIYSTTDWWKNCTGNSSAFGANALVIARYPTSLSSGAGTLPASWSRWTMWQYSSTGPWPGDSDTFNGTAAELVQFARTGLGVPTTPIGSLDSVTTGLESVTVRGWAMDALLSTPTEVNVYIDGRGYSMIANQSRADVAAAYPGRGGNHGFQQTIPTTPGQHEVCTYALGVDTSKNKVLGCSTLTVPTGSPVGSVDSVQAAPGGIAVRGWSLDPESSDSIRVAVYVDAGHTSFLADGARADVGRAWPSNGTAHGFSTTVAASPGTHTVCAYGINVGSVGTNALIGSCSTVNVPTTGGFGSLDSVSIGSTSGGPAVTVSGWAIDGSSADPTSADIYVDGKGTRVTADQTRSDIGRVYPGYGSAHGYARTISVTPGTHSVCAYGISPKGGNNLLGCSTVTVRNTAPFGSLDSATGVQGGIVAKGWAIDPDTSAPIAVHVYVDGRGTAIQAEQQRTDVGRVYPASGALHGYDATVKASSGAHTVCAYAIDSWGGDNPNLGCRTVTVP